MGRVPFASPCSLAFPGEWVQGERVELKMEEMSSLKLEVVVLTILQDKRVNCDFVPKEGLFAHDGKSLFAFPKPQTSWLV